MFYRKITCIKDMNSMGTQISTSNKAILMNNLVWNCYLTSCYCRITSWFWWYWYLSEWSSTDRPGDASIPASLTFLKESSSVAPTAKMPIKTCWVVQSILPTTSFTNLDWRFVTEWNKCMLYIFILRYNVNYRVFKINSCMK